MWRRALASSVAVATLLAGCSGASSKPRSVHTPAPLSCRKSPCSKVGAVRWKVTLGVSMTVAVGQPARYAATDSGISPAWAQVGSTVVIGWGRTVLALDAKTGHRRWRGTSLVPTQQRIVSVRAVSAAIDVATVSAHSGFVTEHILDARTGHQFATIAAIAGEGTIWTDGRSVVAITPSRIARADTRSDQVAWEIKLAPAGYRTRGSPPIAALVAGDRVVFGNVAAGFRAVNLRSGKPVSLKDDVPGPLQVASGTRIVVGSPGAVYDVRTGRTVWTAPDPATVVAYDAKARVAYFTTEGDHRLLGVPVPTGKATLHPNLLGFSDLVTVYGGVAVYQVDSGAGSLPVRSHFIGRSVATGKILWSTPMVPNFDIVGRAYWRETADFLGGFSCRTLHRTAEHMTCPQVQFMALNI